jgi:hypothetical protein
MTAVGWGLGKADLDSWPPRPLRLPAIATFLGAAIGRRTIDEARKDAAGCASAVSAKWVNCQRQHQTDRIR